MPATLWRTSDASGGKVIRGGDGSILRCDDCPCGVCADPSLHELDATFGGTFTQCTGCITTGLSSYDPSDPFTDVAPPGGSFTIPQGGGFGGWLLNSAYATTTNRFDTGDCTGDDLLTGSSARISMLCSGGIYTVAVTHLDTGSIFTGSGPAGATISNINSCGGAVEYSGGTVVITVL